MVSLTCFTALAAVITLISPANALLSNSSLNSQIRFAYAGPTGITVSWNTFVQVSTPTVYYGLTSKLGSTATSTVSVTYNTSLTYNNHVTITGLQPDTVYYYQPYPLMNNGNSEDTTGPWTFKTSKPAGDCTPYSIAVVVDMGTMGPEGLSTTAGKGVAANNVLKPGEINTIQALTAAVDEFEFLWHPGDIAYADYWLKEEQQGFEPNTTIANGYMVYESILNGYYDELTPVTTIKPYMVGPGNHEANCDNGGTGGYTASICMPGQSNFTGYINHFRMPSSQSGGLGNFWYSFDYGMTHYVQFDTETDLGHGIIDPDGPLGGTENSGPFGLMNAQANWLAADLAAVDRCKTPWVVVAGHRPWYTSGDSCPTCQQAFEAVLIENNVDLVLAGHFHVYERNAPIKNGVADPNELNNPSSPWYIINGAAGHYDGLDSFTLPLASFQRFGLSTNDGIYGWSKLTFHNTTHLTHEFINSANGSVIDSATLYREHTCASPECLIPSSSSSSSSTLSATSSATGSAASSASTASGASSGAVSVVYSTQVLTVTSCAASVTNCPARLVTTSYPVSSGSVAPVVTPSVVYSTKLITITSCAASVTNCPARVITTSYPVSTSSAAVVVAASVPVVKSSSVSAGVVKASGTAAVAGTSKTTTAGLVQVTSAASVEGVNHLSMYAGVVAAAAVGVWGLFVL